MKPVRILKNLLESNRSFSHLVNTIAHSPAYKLLIDQKIRHYQDYIKQSKKYNIIIETSNFCNAKCIMCPHQKMKRKHQFMTDTTFNLILKRLKQEKINPLVFILNGFGEPLTDKQIFSRISKIKNSFPQSIVKIYSNISLLHNPLPLLNSGLNEINISFNGYNRQSYQKTMKISYQRSLNNLKKLIKQRQAKQSELKIRISMVLTRENQSQKNKFIKRWASLVDSISINKAHTYSQSVSETADKHKINYHSKNTFPCKYIWNTINIDVNGQVTLCCLDYDSKHIFGNIKKQSILKTFYSPKFNKIRQIHLHKNLSKIPICQTCYTPYKNGVEWLIRDIF